nr:hypothetical protein [Flavobacterium oreochromis]
MSVFDQSNLNSIVAMAIKKANQRAIELGD